MRLDRGANVNAENQYGITPLHIAVEYFGMELIELLVNQGADVNPTNSYNITPLHFALKRQLVKIFKLLLTGDANVNATGKDGETHIHVAAERRNLQILSIFYNMELTLIVLIPLHIGKVIHHCALLLKKDMKKLLSCF
jgi:ankyrin repeat protein